ncbi:hypothetical protein, conserved [Plasmodium ovale wallikeri]|uniref:Uncharacterized protein n=1 Tax=Plasmodium ovale wallikeri TaxID=864142 RepID=A0A1A9AKD6_PLAOA|nr:hypothetical protein, conserved [Plasmodium ovale wallikeri]SBT56683.1 hypothetical protein, conserved [Plasmodium ovale wallikeri]
MLIYYLNSFVIFTREFEDCRNHDSLRKNARNLAQASSLRMITKRTFDCSLTSDELMTLLQILYTEMLALNDIVGSIIMRINRGEAIDNLGVIVREKLRQRILVEHTKLPELRIQNMENRLLEQMNYVFSNFPANSANILYMYDVFKEELDQSLLVVDYAARQKSEDTRNDILNNLSDIRVAFDARLICNNLTVNEELKIDMVLRIRRRAMDIIEHHLNKDSRANNN